MTTFDYPITSSPYKINSTGYTIRQFSVRNPTAYPIYINISSFTPTKDKFDYLIQPNTSVFVSSAIETKEMVIVPATVVVKDTVLVVTVSDTADQQPTGMPQFTPQFTTSVLGYPFIIPTGATGINNLPSFTVDKFLPVFFTLDIPTVGLNRTPFLLRDFSTPIGVFPQNGGVVSYLPNLIPKTLLPSIEVTIATAFPVTINAIQSPQPFDDTYLPFRGLYQIDHTQNLSFYYAVKPPASIFSFSLLPLTGTAYNVTLNLSVNAGENIITANFVGNTSVLIYLIKPKIILGNELIFYKAVVTNNHATQDALVSPQLAPV